MQPSRTTDREPTGDMMRRPMCGGMGPEGTMGKMRGMPMMPMGMAFMSITPALLGFIAGFLVGSNRRR